MLSKTWFEDQAVSSLGRVWGRDRLTVLAYHRIHDPTGFEFFEPVISAPPDGFAHQMDIIAEKFNAVSLADVLSWLDGNGRLPPNPALITFDDGYRDNLEQALPILRERELPAVLFVATDNIDRNQPFFWDSAAYFFHHTEATEADLPILGPRAWGSSPSQVCAEWIEAAKREPQGRREDVTEQLGQVLGVVVPDSAHAVGLLSWDEIREMAGQGFSMGSHTVSHAILTELTGAEARRELVESRRRLEDELNEPVRALAYPNGTTLDFDSQIEGLAKETGYSAAFTLVPGPARAGEAKANPMAIRRIALYLSDEDRRFRAKLAGGGRVKASLS